MRELCRKKSVRLAGSASDVHDVNIEETFSMRTWSRDLRLPRIETELDPMAEGCGGAGEASAALNGAVSGEDTKKKQSTTVADGEAGVEQTEVWKVSYPPSVQSRLRKHLSVRRYISASTTVIAMKEWSSRLQMAISRKYGMASYILPFRLPPAVHCRISV